MRRSSAGLIAALLALAGCKGTDNKPFGKEPTGSPASRPKPKDGQEPPPKWLDPSARLPGADTGVPKAPSWSDTASAKSERQDAVGGRVVDRSGRPAKNVFIRVDSVNVQPGAASGAGVLGIMTDQNGYFFTRGLKAGQTYNLTAEATQEGKQLAGTVQTRVPNAVLTIVLRDDLPLPASGAARSGDEGFPPPPAESERIPPAGAARPTPGDGAFTPGAGATRPVPPSIDAPSEVVPRVGPLPQPEDLSNTPGGLPMRQERPENVADGPRRPFAPPPVSIPGPPGLPPSLPPALPPEPRKMGNRSVPGANFFLVDTLERNWEFAGDRSGQFVLLEFVTTNCPNCKPAVPVLKELQSRYAADGLQVVAVLCDEVPLRQRIAAATKYTRDNNTNYSVFVEPGPQAGAVRDRFEVEGYPSAILLDASGAVLWKGHPARRGEIEAAVKRAVGR